MSDYASQIVAARMQAVNARLSARMQEITSQTGVEFSDIFAQRLAQTAQVTDVSDDITDTAENPESDAVVQTGDSVVSADSYLMSAISGRNNYDELIAEAASNNDLSSALIRAVVWAESNFNSSAVSKAGAMGLMQLMPDTASSLGVDDAFDAKQNVDAGSYLLAEKIKKYGGDVRMALASYNCGDGGLSTRDITDLSDPEQFGRLPEETQSYLSRIEGYLESVGLNIGEL